MVFFDNNAASERAISIDLCVFFGAVALLFLFCRTNHKFAAIKEAFTERLMMPIVRPEVRCPPKLHWKTWNTNCSNQTLKLERDTVFGAPDLASITQNDYSSDPALADPNMLYSNEMTNMRIFQRDLKLQGDSIKNKTYNDYLAALTKHGKAPSDVSNLDYITFLNEKAKMTGKRIIPKYMT